MEDSIQMWLESYNTYHLVDGAAMKEAWGSIMPHIMLAEKNLDAILDQVCRPFSVLFCVFFYLSSQLLSSIFYEVLRGYSYNIS
jgi:hypothetical protein